MAETPNPEPPFTQGDAQQVIALVDDDRNILTTVSIGLQAEGFATRVYTDGATALKALAHPVRMRMLGLLRLDGPATATRLAERLGLNSGATSYHLRQLALHGFIEEEPRASRRDRWWRARHESTSFVDKTAEGEKLEAGVAFMQAGLAWQVGAMQQALQEFTELPVAWRKATANADFTSGGISVKAGDYIIRGDQPFRTIADIYFSVQRFSSSNPSPYDDTGWTLQYTRDVAVLPATDRSLLTQAMRPVAGHVRAAGGMPQDELNRRSRSDAAHEEEETP